MSAGAWVGSFGGLGDWGLVRKPERWPVLPATGDEIIGSIDHLNNIVPTYSQQLPSCVGHATANWIECVLRLTHGRGVLKPREQIDGDAIYERGREMFFAGKKGGGLQLSQGFSAAIDLGILPKDTEIVAVEPTLYAISAALIDAPLVQGHVVSKDWQYASFSNGALPGKTRANILEGAHATLAIGIWIRDGKVMLPFQNSWGAGWGWNGVGQMTWAQWKDGIRWLINPEDDVMRGDGPYTAKLPENWKTWNGWKKFVVKV